MTIDIAHADFSLARDGRAIVALLDDYARDPMGGGEPLSPHAREHLIPSLAARPTAHALIGRVDGLPGALALFFEGFSTFACRPLLNLHDFMVSRPYRGTGLGQGMLEELERYARATGCCKITLEVLSGNGPAQSLYRRMGFANYRLAAEMGHAEFWQKAL